MKIALIGYGRMGKAIEKIALEKGHEIVLKINVENADMLTTSNLENADVAIEFSVPEVAFHLVASCLRAGVPVVSGTTGWTARLPEIKSYCEDEKGAFLYASNFSIGMNIFFEVNKKLAQMMNSQSQYEISMEEIHHIHKLDSPSGTAITLAQQIIEEVDRKTQYKETEVADNETIAIQAKRIEDTLGTHSVEYRSPIDTIEIKHTAHSRDGFAKGALLAAEWIHGKQGVFSMKDVLF